MKAENEDSRLLLETYLLNASGRVEPPGDERKAVQLFTVMWVASNTIKESNTTKKDADT
ncbi:MAG: hypothetical protein KDA91_14700 [Planctomycetaceae bacterium]|nr:hypothetical protein [Planctomycetaceae bacterium]